MLSQAAGKCGIMAAMLFLCKAASDEMVEDEQPDLPYPAPFSCLPTEQVQAPVVAPSKQLHPPQTWKRDLKKRSKSNIEIKSNEVPHVASKEVPHVVSIQSKEVPDVGKSDLVPHVSEIESLNGTDLEKALEVEMELKEEIMPESKEEVPVEFPKPKEGVMPELEGKKAPSLPAIQDKPKLKRLRSKQHVEAFEAPSAKARAVRGSAGTFAGRRPPKDPILKATFESIRDTFPDGRNEAKEKYGITLSLDNYWFHMQKALKNNDGNIDLASDEFKKHLAVEYSRADES